MTSNVHIRAATPDDYAGIAKVHVDSWRATYRGIIPDSFLDQLTYEGSESRWRQSATSLPPHYAMFVAETQPPTNEIVGFANGGHVRASDAEFQGELYAIYLLPSYQRQGIGQQLFYQIVQHLTEHGYPSLLIWVLKDNPARFFYERLGGTVIREATINIGGQPLTELGYSWTLPLTRP
ncbi:MAG: GNAT family N-acetyltransferase [Sulfobacillus sp.]|nr:GNAT family N-acetyltransferase [Sulfobacillus sp.]